MSWFPNDPAMPEDSNIKIGQETTSLWLTVLDKEKRSSMKTDGLTFIIPVGMDSTDRSHNLSDTLMYLLTSTTARIKIVLSETEKNIRASAVYQAFRALVGEDRLVEYFKNVSSPDEFSDVTGTWSLDGDYGTLIEDGSRESFARMILISTICRYTEGDNELAVGNSGSWTSTMSAIQQHGIKRLASTALFANFFSEVLERVDMSIVLRSDDSPFERMKYINLALATVDTEFVCNHDADVLLTRSALYGAIAQLKETAADFVYPYSHQRSRPAQLRIFRSLPTNQQISLACLTGDFTTITQTDSYIPWGAAYGQSIFARTKSYKAAGGENENFVSWGAEDVERYVRFIKLGYSVGRVNCGFVLHLEHERGPDSSSKNPYFAQNENLWRQLQTLTAQQLIDTYRNFEYTKSRGFMPTLKKDLRDEE